MNLVNEISILCVSAFIVGSIPVGALVARARGVDILSKGSGNIGATNVYRVLGPKAGIIVSILDILKGYLPSFVALQFLADHPDRQIYALCVGLAAVLGHCFSPFLRFRGGKGISTGFGALLGASPVVALSGLAVFVTTIAISRYVSLGSIFGVISIVIVGLILGESPILVGMYSVLAIFIVYKHRGNMSRLLAGTENRFKLKPDSKDSNIKG